MLFDLDGTLYTPFPLRVAMLCEMSIVCAATVARGGARVPRVLRTFRKMREELRHQKGLVEPLAVRQYSVVSDRLRCSLQEVENIVHEWMYRRPLKWLWYCRRAGLIDLLQFLESRGIPKGVFSDYPAHDKLAALGLAGRFDVVVSAVDADVDAFKPDPRGYLAAAAQWGVPPQSVLYVGDRMEVDAQGAIAAGMPCAVLTRDAVVGAGVVAIRDFRELEDVVARCC